MALINPIGRRGALSLAGAAAVAGKARAAFPERPAVTIMPAAALLEVLINSRRSTDFFFIWFSPTNYVLNSACSTLFCKKCVPTRRCTVLISPAKISSAARGM